MKFEATERLKALPPYLFVEIDRKRRAAVAAGHDVINLGIGDPDLPTHDFILDALRDALANPNHHRYPPNDGIPRFKDAVARFFGRRYAVQLDPATQIHPLIGSKEGLGHLPLATVNPGRTVLVPEPGYPVYRSAAIFAGGVPYTMPLTESRHWLPDLDAIPPDVASSAALMFLNYPNNPTGACAPLSFYEQAVEFAHRNDIIIASDAAYNEMYFDDPPPPSILQVEGADEVAVELHSCSKTFNMTGWRLGFIAGNPQVIAALARVKANLDSGPFGAIQEAGAAAYDGIERNELRDQIATYRERRNVLCDGLRKLGFQFETPKATFYVWTRVPNCDDSMAAVNRILDEAAVVCVPGTGFGSGGEGYVRFALTVDVARIRTVVARLSEMKW